MPKTTPTVPLKAKDITTAHWTAICSISAIKAVAKIVGGYYIH